MLHVGSREMAAQAALAQEIGEALLRYAGALRGQSNQGPEDKAVGKGPSGRRQREVLSLKGVATQRGVTAGEVADALSIRQPNAYTLLTSLVDGGWLEPVPEVDPAHWRKVRTRSK
jgi:hypothetical protein